MVFAITFINSRSAAITLERRITRLRDGAEKVAAGNLEYRISVQGDDELAEFGGAFDRMTAQLQGTYTSLETEVADRRRAQDDVARLNDQLLLQVAALEVSNRELEAFSYAVSHDLRAPLRSVSGFSQAVLEDYGSKLDATGRQYLELASEAAREMGQLIDDLIGLSRVARVDMRREPVDLSELGRSVIDELRRAEPERQVDVEIAPALMVEGDPTLLRLAIENLLRNAWKFTSRHPTARIGMGRTTSRGQEAFFVADDGAGFEMAYVDKLFNPFQRLHRTSEFPGTGIGLATVRRIVRRHGGEAWAHGEAERGATIYFTLPSREGTHAGQDHPAGRGQPEGRAPDRAGLQAEQDRQPAPRGA
jgi:signal transduction histidine kinase